MSDAIARTLWRLFVSRRHLLEWTARGADVGGDSVSISRGSPSECRGRLSSRSRLCWSGAPFRAWRLADCGAVRRALADLARGRALRQLFSGHREPREDFGGRIAGAAAERAPHLAVLRNVRDGATTICCRRTISRRTPHPEVAHRTSPTNIGLYLLSVVCARDFGWIGATQAIERLEATLGDDGSHAALSRPLLQLVRHPRSQGRSSPNIFPPSTAAIWPAISSRSPTPARNGGNRRWPPRRVGPESPMRSP